VNQIETNPFNQQTETHAFFNELGIVHEGWAPFAEGQHDIFKNEVLSRISEKYGKSIAQVILRWNVQREVVSIPKSVSVERIRDNFDVFNFELTDDDMQSIASLDQKLNMVNHNDPAFLKYLNDRVLK
jgi:diketogulonate reductase-like aldo/keto reductase